MAGNCTVPSGVTASRRVWPARHTVSAVDGGTQFFQAGIELQRRDHDVGLPQIGLVETVQCGPQLVEGSPATGTWPSNGSVIVPSGSTKASSVYSRVGD